MLTTVTSICLQDYKMAAWNIKLIIFLHFKTKKALVKCKWVISETGWQFTEGAPLYTELIFPKSIAKTSVIDENCQLLYSS